MTSNAMIPAGASGLAVGPFGHPTYTIKRPFFSFFDRVFRVYAPDGSLVLYVKHPVMKLREEFRLFADEAQQFPILLVRARQIIALNVCHDVFDAQSGVKVGTLRTRGLKSIVRDTWDILDPNDQPVGLMQEDSIALLRRVLPFIPSRHHVELGGGEVCRVTQQFRFFTKEFTVDLSMGMGRMDPRFALACSLLALMAEIHRQEAART